MNLKSTFFESKKTQLQHLLILLFSLFLLSVSFLTQADIKGTQFESQVDPALVNSKQGGSVQQEQEKQKSTMTSNLEVTSPEKQELEVNVKTGNEKRASQEAKDIEEHDNRKKIYKSAVSFAQWIDNFFGEAEELESASYDFLRLVNTFGWREGEGMQYRPRINAKVNLPRMDKKFSLMFADSNDITNSEFESLQSNELFKDDSQKPSAAINYESDYYARSKVDSRIGIDSSLDLFALIKHTYNVYEDENLTIKNYNYLFWKEKEHFGINPRIELNYVINQQNLFRWKYSIMNSEKSEGNEWRNTLSLVHQFSKESWLSYDFDITGASAHNYDVDTYRLALRYRRQLNTKWLYFEIEPEVLWHMEPEYVERKVIPGLIFRLEIQFEN